MNNVVSVKTKENVRKLRDIKIFTTEKKETIWCQNQIITLQNFSISISNANGQNADTYQ